MDESKEGGHVGGREAVRKKKRKGRTGVFDGEIER